MIWQSSAAFAFMSKQGDDDDEQLGQQRNRFYSLLEL
jgi:hypothetical protein